MVDLALKELNPTHDLTHLRWALRYCERFGVAVDGGAHQGIWTRELMKRFDRVIAFEPVSENRRWIPFGATVYPYALGEKEQTVGIKSGTENTGQYHVTPGREVMMVPLDSFHIPCDFLKLDVEGYELPALQGAEQLIKRCKPVVMIEENGLCTRYGIEPLEADEWLKRIGYECVGKMNKDYLYKWTQ